VFAVISDFNITVFSTLPISSQLNRRLYNQINRPEWAEFERGSRCERGGYGCKQDFKREKWYGRIRFEKCHEILKEV
jgi:hypothetical protein